MPEPLRLWGGRFSQPLDASVVRLSSTASSAWRLVPYDLLQSTGHASSLQTAGLLTEAECARILAALGELQAEFESGEFMPHDGEEDIHSAIERGLVDKLGELGGRLRAGRSRNDQAAADLRLYLRDALRDVALGLADLQRALADRAQCVLDVVAPGMTHLQHAQPVPLAHQLLAHAHPLSRDAERIRDWDRRAAISPLGAAALAGSTIPVDPQARASALGFNAPAANSIDAVADRDFVAEAVFTMALAAVHISRLAEDLILWTSEEFGWAELDDRFATGSSIMPQKKNPDVAEIGRGKAGRLIGNLAGFLSTLKGLPLAYNRDMQEDKDTSFDAVDTMLLVLPAMTGLVRTLRFREERIMAAAAQGNTLATDLAERLVQERVPFREAHEIVGRLVALSAEHGWDLDALPEHEVIAVAGKHADEVRRPISLQAATRARTAPGATAPQRIEEQLAAVREDIAAQLAWAVAGAPFRLDSARR